MRKIFLVDENSSTRNLQEERLKFGLVYRNLDSIDFVHVENYDKFFKLMNESDFCLGCEALVVTNDPNVAEFAKKSRIKSFIYYGGLEARREARNVANNGCVDSFGLNVRYDDIHFMEAIAASFQNGSSPHS